MCLAIPGKIVELIPDQAHLGACLGTVEVTGVRRKVDLGLLQDDMPMVGDWVLIHVGFAMTKISEQDALEQMRLLTMLGETEQAMQEVRGYGLEDSGDHKSVNAGTGSSSLLRANVPLE
jgi:hydrogenase expression/formation protein HypC